MNAPRKKSRKPALAVATVLLAALIVLIVLPFGIRYGIIKVINQQGAEHAVIENVDFNPFAGSLGIYDLSVKKGNTTPLSISRFDINISWLQLIRKRIYIESLLIDGASVSVSQESDSRWSIAGFILPGEKEEGTDEKSGGWGLGAGQLQITSGSVNVRISAAEAAVNIKQLNINNVKSWVPDLKSTFDLSAIINDGVVTVSAVAMPFSESGEVAGNVNLQGLSLEPLNSLMFPGNNLKVSKGTVGIAGDFYFNKGIDAMQYGYNGDASIENLIVLSPHNKLMLVGFKRLDIKEIRLNGAEDINVLKVEADNLEIAGLTEEERVDEASAESLVKTEKVEISGIELKELSKVSINRTGIKKAGVVLHRSADGKLPAIDAVLKALSGEEQVEEKRGDQGELLAVKIAEIEIAENSSIGFIDKTVDPPYRVAILLDNLMVRNIDSTSPDESSTITVQGKIGEFSGYKIEGDFKPFAEAVTARLSGNINELDLHNLSSYTASLLGYNVNSGHANADISLNITAGAIDGKNDLVLKKLKITSADAGKVEKLVSDLTISLETALSLLRDKDGTIRLNLPVSGDISDPKIDLGDLMNKALVGALKKAAFSYLKHVIQPYGTLITVIELAGEAARIRLDPVSFSPGLTALSPETVDYLEVVAKLMKERPEIQVSVCGIAASSEISAVLSGGFNQHEESGADSTNNKVAGPGTGGKDRIAAVSKEELLALGKERALTVKRHLIEKQSIEPGRLFICNPEIDVKKKGSPRADLLI